MGKKLVVNADDFGHSKGTSQGICLGYLNGIVTSTTAMMNYPTVVDDLKKAVKDCPRMGLGVHLVLTSGKPLSPSEEVPSLIDKNGNFFSLPEFQKNINRIKLAEVESEWRTQIRAFRAATNRKPDHLDSHHHISYASPALFELMAKLANELGCPVRVPFNTTGTIFRNANKAWENTLQYGYAKQFIGDFYDHDASQNHLKKIMHQLADDAFHGTFELMCHPAIVDDALRHTSAYNDRRADELAALCSQEIKSLVKDLGIELIKFPELRIKEQPV